MHFTGAASEFLELDEVGPAQKDMIGAPLSNGLRIIWNSGERLDLLVDSMPVRLERDQLLFLTEHYHVEAVYAERCRLVRFDRPFFCVINSDSEVGCKGILFFGASELPTLTIPPEEREKFDILWRMFTLEMSSRDALQMEMLHTMLKRLLILCTRIYTSQRSLGLLKQGEVDIAREFNYLVEIHYRSKRTVAEYAELLHRSPKTLANLFAQLGKRTPLKMIQDRVMLEARRLLRYSDRPVGDIGYELGFEDVQTFSRFFKTNEGVSPSEFRSASLAGTIANSSGNAAYQGP